jgi:ABC-type bacteriocin/lantibiotic exporter with double-glycine peptidase domain
MSYGISDLPDGLNTRLNDKGSNLSGGQKQRIGIARAILKSPEIYIFDEITSALDQETEKGILETIRTHLGDKTVINITHKPELQSQADHLVRLT